MSHVLFKHSSHLSRNAHCPAVSTGTAMSAGGLGVVVMSALHHSHLFAHVPSLVCDAVVASLLSLGVLGPCAASDRMPVVFFLRFGTSDLVSAQKSRAFGLHVRKAQTRLDSCPHERNPLGSLAPRSAAFGRLSLRFARCSTPGHHNIQCCTRQEHPPGLYISQQVVAAAVIH